MRVVHVSIAVSMSRCIARDRTVPECPLHSQGGTPEAVTELVASYCTLVGCSICTRNGYSGRRKPFAICGRSELSLFSGVLRRCSCLAADHSHSSIPDDRGPAKKITQS